MMTIADIMKRLSQVDMDILMAAFEAGTTAYVEWSPHRYIGVYTDAVPHLIKVQEAGLWREGKIQNASQ
jgi:hypothetical protein